MKIYGTPIKVRIQFAALAGDRDGKIGFRMAIPPRTFEASNA